MPILDRDVIFSPGEEDSLIEDCEDMEGGEDEPESEEVAKLRELRAAKVGP